MLYFKGFVNELVSESLNNNDTRSLSVAFLVIRQVSLQGGHVFQPYVTWFQVSVTCVGFVPEMYSLFDIDILASAKRWFEVQVASLCV